jgi:4-azaleucine resistance transporter AzlC
MTKRQLPALRSAFPHTVPVLTGYLVLGFGFGIVLKANGFGAFWAFIMSLFIYAGSMQYVAIGFLSGGVSLLTVALTTLAVNARHLFYGISMLKPYQKIGKVKPYLIFALTDETYSLVCRDVPGIDDGRRGTYYLLVSLLNHFYWVVGSVLGAVAGTLVHFNSQGIDFALTALFLTVFLEQWLTAKKHAPALIGVGASVVCLLVFGSERFLIPAMLVIALCLSVYKGGGEDD